MITEISTVGMTREEWLALRRESIGGSDAATIAGVDPYGSVYELWAEKLVKIPPKEDNEAMRQGRDLEDYVAKRFCEETGKKVKRKNAVLKNLEFPFAHANVDRLVVGEKAGLECKTTSLLNLGSFKDGDFPANYYVQCQHYMMVTGFKKWYLAVLVLGREFLTFEIARNDNDIKALAELEENFWSYVVNEKEPPADGGKGCMDALNALYPESTPDTETDLTPLARTLEERMRLAETLKNVKDNIAEKDNEIKAYMGRSERGFTEKYNVSWKTQKRKTFDWKRFSEEHKDVDITEYFNVSNSRVFKIKEL